MKSTHVTFRAEDRLISAVAEQAKTSGCTVSEYLRSVLREKVGVQ